MNDIEKLLGEMSSMVVDDRRWLQNRNQTDDRREALRRSIAALRIATAVLSQYDSECSACGGSGVQTNKVTCGCNRFDVLEEVLAALKGEK